MLQNGIQVLNISQKKQSSSESVVNHDNFKIITCANTDNMGKLFPEVSGQVVTVFAFPACLRQSGRAPALKTNL